MPPLDSVVKERREKLYDDVNQLVFHYRSQSKWSKTATGLTLEFTF